MEASEIALIYTRDLDKLYKEIESYSIEEHIWVVKPGISNSAGNLCLHLVGSISHFIGATLGNTGYIRDRDEEFLLKDLPTNELLAKVSACSSMASQVINGLSQENLKLDFKFDFAGKKSIGSYLVFFAGHLNYHLGQINYHRRLIEAN
ncbi:MAG: DinB family protein [Opitutaceae bacterium]|nr:DinB family protein [Cytophagales bacterium]